MSRYFNPNMVPGCLTVLLFMMVIRPKPGYEWCLPTLLALYITFGILTRERSNDRPSQNI